MLTCFSTPWTLLYVTEMQKIFFSHNGQNILTGKFNSVIIPKILFSFKSTEQIDEKDSKKSSQSQKEEAE